MMLYLQAHQHSGLVAPLPSLPEIPSQSSPANTPPAHQITSSTIIAFTNRSNQAALDARKTKAITFPSLKRVADNNADIYDFMQDWREARKARETAFIRRNSSLASTVTTLSDIIYDRMLHSMAKDLEHVVDDYSQAFIKTV